MTKQTRWEQLEREATRQEKRWRQSLPIDCTYQQSLERYLKKELVEIADYYLMLGISHMTKPQLIDELVSQRDFSIYHLLQNLTKPQQALFWEAKEHGYLPINNSATQKVGWWWRTTLLVPATIDGKFVLILPKDVRESPTLQLFEEEVKMRARQNDAILEFTRGLLNTFGVLRFADFCAYLRNYQVIENSEQVQHVRTLLWVQQDFYEELLLDGNLVVVPGLDHPYALFDQISDRADLQPVELTPAEVVKRAHESYYLELSEYKNFARYLEKATTLAPHQVESIMFDFGVQLNNQVSFHDILNQFFKLLRELTPKSMQDVIRFALAAQDVTPHYALKGHTPKFLSQQAEGQTLIQESAKVRRNDPCSCGSGKKYKKCCM